ncbi:helix-turn-helix transcriptional regulator [Lichenihabitans sp. Uapishka_5]|nr:helix-turn-helix transcriptional regulator [Lichenihabitans sp. Uapishka_5]
MGDEADAPRGMGRRGRGGPFGRHRGGPFGGRGPRMFDPGALRLVVLGLIAEAPRHGYDIIKALEARFAGAYSPSPGSIYPMLQMLEEADLVTSVAEGNKRLFTITDGGRGYLAENAAELARVQAQLDEASGDIRQSALAEEVMALRMTVFRRLRHGVLSPDQADQARQILRSAREALDRL